MSAGFSSGKKVPLLWREEGDKTFSPTDPLLLRHGDMRIYYGVKIVFFVALFMSHHEGVSGGKL